MNIESYRSSFTVCVLDGNLSRGSMVAEDLAGLGYSSLHMLSQKSFTEQLESHPPHIVVLNYSDDVFCLNHEAILERVQWLRSKLPEVHVLVLAKEVDLEAACELYSAGVYDVIEFPVFPKSQLGRSVDRAATTDYFLYMNEQLRQSQSPVEAATHLNFQLFELWNEQMGRVVEESQLVALTLKELGRALPFSQFVFLKHVRGRSTLVAESSVGVNLEDIKGIGVDLKQTEPSFRESLLTRPENLVGVVDLVRNGFQSRNFAAFPVLVQKEVWGVLLILTGDVDASDLQSDPYLRACLSVLGSRLLELHLNKKLLKLSVFDEVSESLNRQFFIKKLKEEISRARRVNKPVALLIFQLDQLKDISLTYDAVEVERFIKSFVALILKNSRITDLLGRLIEDQFAMVLPYTHRKGATIKAERLRRIVESADFSEILPGNAKVTISVGVSEYPSVCEDGSELMRTADEALVEVIKASQNKVCVASPKPNFEPDFKVG